MSNLSTTAWIVHNLGLATSLGGTMFGQGAFQPALQKDVSDEQKRGQISDDAWSRYSWWNLAAHGLVAATWFAGRTKLSGREISGNARKLTMVKDVLVVASLVSGVSSVIVGKVLGAKAKRQQQDNRTSDEEVDGLRAAVKTIGTVNMVTNAAISAVTTALSMEGMKSLPAVAVSRLLP